MRILVAEDELLERKAMKKFIQENFRDMEVVGEAENGRRAIELAKEKQPNIIFMDIKMPGINGLEAVEQIHAVQPNIKFILVSAYDTFDYAKQAMQFGIKDYILKPGKKEEIVKALFRLQKEIVDEEKLEEEKRQSRQLLEERFIRRLIEQPLQEDVFELQNQLYPQMKYSYFLVFGGNGTANPNEIRRSLEKYLSNPFILYETNDIVVAIVIIDDIEGKATQLITVRKLSLELKNSLFIGIGHICDSLENLPTSYQGAYGAFFQLRTEGKSHYGFLNESDTHLSSEEYHTKIVEEVEKGNTSGAVENFKKYSHLLGKTEKENLYIAIQNLLMRRNISNLKSSITSLQTDEDWQMYLNLCCMKVNEIYQSMQSMTIAKKYIEEHFSKNITLEDVAILVQLSPNYFSNLFKEEFGETFIEFLTRTRMLQAKLLIEKNAYSLKEICFKVGYKDPNYFSRVFKKYYHTSPKHFQNSIFEK